MQASAASAYGAAAFLDAALERPASREEALWLAESAPLPALLEAAQAVRNAAKGRVVSFSKKVFIPLTHLCRDYCGYCTFRSDPREGLAPYLAPEEVLALAEAGRRAGCKEALFSLGDQPERVFREAREFLRLGGFDRTLEYLAAMTRLVLEETGLLPHSNPGLMGPADLRVLRESNASLGLMLESASPRLGRAPGPHWKAPDKVPALRLRALEDAGRLSIACTTGLLIGIGETFEERVDSLLALRRLHETYGHIQEIILQPFRAKPGTRMAGALEPSNEELLRTLAAARLIFGGAMNIQSPPNLLSENYPALLAAGINDWGGISPVTRDFINPEAAWPQIASLEEITSAAGYTLRERLAIYPEFLARPGFLAGRVESAVRAWQAPDGYARAEG